MDNNDLQKLKEFITQVSAEGLMIDRNGLQQLQDIGKSTHPDPIQFIQFIFNEGSKAGSQHILNKYREYINLKYR